MGPLARDCASGSRTTAPPADRRRPCLSGGVVFLAALALGAAADASAQDTHYWSIQYGPVGQLVGGQLIGGVPDLSATFYNPGALSLRNESSYLLSTESVQWEVVTTDAQPGLEVFDSSSSKFGAAPSLLAGVLPRWFGRDTRLAWSFLTRQKLDVRLGERLTDPVAGAHSAAETFVDQRAEEDWGGLTISRPVSDSVGVGITLYGVYRGQNTRKELTVQAVSDAMAQAVAGVVDYHYSHYRALAKLGVVWQSRDWNAGLSLTTPSLAVLGSGSAGYTLSLTGVDLDQDGRPDDPVLETATYDDVDSHYRSPWAVGLGASRRLGDTRVYVSAEYYASVARYDVLAVPEGAVGGDQLRQQLGSVLNGGIGFEHTLASDIAVYGAFHTDFTASEGGPQSNVALSDWNLYHWSGGASFPVRGNRFTLGASWARGQKVRPLDPALPVEGLPARGLDQDLDIHYQKLTFLLGFVFGN